MKITLANLKDATAQQVFNQVATHLLTQNAKSQKHPDRMCLYRAQDNLSCAAGCLIDDDEYVKSFEGQTWVNLIGIGDVSSNHRELIHALQELHDGSPVNQWKNNLTNVARDFELDETQVELLNVPS